MCRGPETPSVQAYQAILQQIHVVRQLANDQARTGWVPAASFTYLLDQVTSEALPFAPHYPADLRTRGTHIVLEALRQIGLYEQDDHIHASGKVMRGINKLYKLPPRPTTKTSNANNPYNKIQTQCYICGKRGHKATQCYLRNQNPQNNHPQQFENTPPEYCAPYDNQNYNNNNRGGKGGGKGGRGKGNAQQYYQPQMGYPGYY